jgi:putative oxidoreductase
MEIGLLLLRSVIGFTLAAHGAQKLFGSFGGYGLEGTGGFMESIGFRPGRRHALTAGLVEFAGGLLLALGLMTPAAAAAVVAVMLVAAVSVHLKGGFFATGGGYEYNLVLAAGALAVAFTGPGTLSLDALFGLPLSGPVWGAGALLVGVIGGAVQLAGRSQGSTLRTAAAE